MTLRKFLPCAAAGRWLLTLGLGLGVVLLSATSGRAAILDASWTAPTMNTDGSPLTELSFYWIYYGTSDLPCPGLPLFLLPSSTASPPSNERVNLRLTGLLSETLYYVSVTAVDANVNESACSITASAVARIAHAVSPTGTADFGTVNVGTYADQVFIVSNIVGETVSGNVSTSPPFTIVSGSTFRLVGLGAAQVVTVRFLPSADVTATANVNFTADGDTRSRIAKGTGIGTDITLPTIAVTLPTPNPTFTTISSTMTLAGTASDIPGVTQVAWVNDRGGSGTASGTTAWTADGIVLQLGENVLTVTARDAAGNTTTATLTVILEPAFPLTVSLTGAGTVTSTPDVGIACGETCSARFVTNSVVTLTASPAAGSAFTGWSGGGCSRTGGCVNTVRAGT